ncbi:hypothetical protein [Streptomyces doebereineriae]|uniref:Transposase n=1 Tax=Streptomyces doebereineriae TaxID=3075528 RepID=A0ABU2V201_9ACTN|nr:hypothetical protein [Streptomyces sp. DSM 41640]MDT0479585.1 hypothetical protein [Streptomyces sp. DSM 41640]
MSCRTVALALESVWPAPRKHRQTVKQVFDRPVDEHDAQGVTYSMLRAYIFQRRSEIRVAEGRGPPQAFVPQTHRPGDEAEVDFGDVWIDLDGVSTKVFLFSLRLSFSRKAAHNRDVTRATCSSCQ